MVMDRQERHRAVRQTKPAAVAVPDATRALRMLSTITRVVKPLRQGVEAFTQRFSMLTPVTQIDKRTAFMDAVSAETDGMLILHDVGEFLDRSILIINDFRDPNESIAVAPFTDANVDFYEANGVSD